jgi:hypothetical protein
MTDNYSRATIAPSEMSLSSDRQAVSGVLVSNTMVCEVSRLLVSGDRFADRQTLLDSSSGARLDQLRMLDLFSLIEAAILNERLYTLPCKPPNDEQWLVLRNALTNAGILEVLHTRNVHSVLANSISRTIESAAKSLDPASRGANLNLQNVLQQFFVIDSDHDDASEAEKRQDQSTDTSRILIPESTYDDPDDPEAVWNENDQTMVEPDSLDELRTQLSAHLAPKEYEEYEGSGAYESPHMRKKAFSVLRSMYYIYAAESFMLPYWPQYTRQKFARRFPNYLDTSTRNKLYQILATSFRASVADLFDDQHEHVTLIPPFSTIVFDASRSVEDIPNKLLQVREQFASLRQRMSSLEAERKSARTLKDRRRVLNEIRRLCESAAKRFKQPSTIKLETVLRFVPELTKPLLEPVLEPTNPKSYLEGFNLLLKSAEWLKQWFSDRPLSPLFDVWAKVDSISDYEKLISKVFGQRFYYAEKLKDVAVSALVRP